MSELDRIQEIIDEINRLVSELYGRLTNAEYLQNVDMTSIPQIISSLQNVDMTSIPQIISSLQNIVERDRELRYALQRINLRNEYYRFVRAVDGDTIVVLPPNELKSWMKDIHIRLYGLETPELWEEEGKEYKQHLENLCRIDADEKLFIVWERERIGANYENFPLGSFERGIGHVFFQVGENTLVYLNGLMHLLKSSSLRRNGKLMLRGRSYFGRQFDHEPIYINNCPIPLRFSEEVQTGNEVQAMQKQSQTWQMIEELHPPVCLIAFPKSEILHADINTDQQLAVLSSSISAMNCPFSKILPLYEKFNSEILERKMSPFDFPLFFISQWSEAQGF